MGVMEHTHEETFGGSNAYPFHRGITSTMDHPRLLQHYLKGEKQMAKGASIS
jgi:hypothetical protein